MKTFISLLALVALVSLPTPSASFAGDVFLPASMTPVEAVQRIRKETRFATLPNAAFNRGVETYVQTNLERLRAEDVSFLTGQLRQTEIVIPIPGPCCLYLRFDQDWTKNSREAVRERINRAWITDRRDSGKPDSAPAPESRGEAATGAQIGR